VSVISPKSPFGNQSQRSFHIWLFATPPDGGGIFDGIDVIDKVDGIYSGQN
jgi:hypothetical protein